MSKIQSNQSGSLVRKLFSRRRPEGVSRRQKHRRLQFECLEVRQVLSADTGAAVLDSQAVLRDALLDSQVLQSFQRASDLTHYSQEELADATQWVVLADLGSDLSAEASAGGFQVNGETGIVPGSFVITPGAGGAQSLIDSLSGSEAVDFFYPLIERESAPLAVPNDPYLVNQWNLINFGQLVGGEDFQFIRGVPDEDINIEGAWDVATGTGVQIGIVDTGVQAAHPDLKDNVRDDLAVSFAGTGTVIDPHGTAVAGIAAGVGNNNIGITGVAYDADIVPIRISQNEQDGVFTVSDFTVAQALLYQFQTIDVYNNSWGIVGATPREIVDFGPLATTALRNAVFFGRGGLGSIHVFAAGNDGGASTSSQYSGLTNSRYTIAVTAVDHDGSRANVDGTSTGYPEGGANVLVAAPSGSNPLGIIRDTQLGSGIYTTDFAGDNGYNQGPDINGIELDNDGFFDTDFSSRFSGTSAAAPVVSGVIALMLQVNPTLTYRDVQNILVRSARQNDPTDSSWIVNQREVQLEPLPPVDIGFPPSNGEMGTFDPNPDALWPSSPSTLIGQTPQHFMNGAGFTVSQQGSSYGEYGYGHGVVDAALAVRMAMNWRTVGTQQTELTWTTSPTLEGKVWGGEVSSDETGRFLIPGGITGDGDTDKSFPDYYNQFGDDSPFVDDMGNVDEDIPFDDRDIYGLSTGFPGIPILDVPSMSVEWVEVELNLGGDLGDINQLRVMLVSPDGTYSDLNVFGQTRPNSTDHNDLIGSFSTQPDVGTTDLIFSTNRHWGERTEPKMRVDEQGEPVLDFNGNPIFDTWRLVFENYSEGDINIGTYEVAFHGVTTENTGRIQGAIGVDDNADGFFSSDPDNPADNFTRFVEEFDPNQPSISLGRDFNPKQESYAAGVIVYVDVDQDGLRGETEPYYMVGDDGNYYFDINPGTYDIRIDSTSLPEGLNNVQNIQNAELNPISRVTVAVGQRVTPFEMPPTPEEADAFKALNTVLIPDTPSIATTFDISGVVFADLDGDGIQNNNDATIEGVDLFLDINQNGIFDPIIDQYKTTAGDGTYSFTDVEAPIGFYSVFVVPGTTGSFPIPTFPDSPADMEQGVFAKPGDDITGVKFGFTGIPDDGGDGGGDGGIDPTTPGSISGVVFIDANNTGVRDGGELGFSGARVYIDANGDNVFNTGETNVFTSSNGSYLFNDLAPAQTYVVRIETPTAYVLTAPPGGEIEELIIPGETAINRDFGIRSLATDDFGDLPNSFGATTGANAARHTLGSPFFLGLKVDSELDGFPSDAADGDDLNALDDEDGVVVDPITNLTSVWRMEVTANTTGGYLQAWADFDGSGTFEPGEKLTFKDTAASLTGHEKKLLDGGVNELFVDVPAGVVATNTTGNIYVRFRYGEIDINSFTGPALRGEVEDYQIPITAINPGAQIIHGADFDEDGDVDGLDFLAWSRGFGITSGATAAQGDANSDGKVDQADLQIWQDEYGTTSAPQVAALATGGDDSGNTPVSFDMDSAQAKLATLLASVDAVPVSSGFSTSTQSESATLSTLGGTGLVSDSSLTSTATEVSAHESTFGRSTSRTLSGVANEVVRRFGSHNQNRPQLASRLDAHRIDQVFEKSSELADNGLALREGIHDRHLARLHHRLDHEQHESPEEDFETAFDLALSEETLWRAM